MAPARRKGTIFIADDEPAFRESIQEALEDVGYLVLPARGGTEALARMHGFSGNGLAIVDLNMPEMDGWELIENMRADQNLAHIPIVVVSSHGRQTTTRADRHLEKPVRLGELLRTVQELMA